MMRWLPFVVLAVVGIVCQTTIVPYLPLRERGVGPDWMFILAIYYALWGPWPEAAIAGWILGFIFDLFTLSQGGRVGLHAFCYGAAAWGIIHVRQVVVRSHWMAQLLIALVFSLGIEILVVLYHQWSVPRPGMWGGLGQAILSAVYTAVCAPFLLWGLMRLGRLTGLRAEARPRAPRRRA